MSATVMLNQARAHMARGQMAPAIDLLKKVCAQAPTLADAHADLAQAHFRSGQPKSAIPYARRALDLAPDHPVFAFFLGHCLCMTEQFAEGTPLLQRAAEMIPGDPSVITMLIEAHTAQRHPAEALRWTQIATERFPDEPSFAATLVSALADVGDIDAAWRRLQHALSRFPTHLRLNGSRAILSNYIGDCDRAAQFTWHTHVAGLIAAAMGDPVPASPRPLPTDGPLRVGLISPDLKKHSVAYYAEAILKHLDRRTLPLTIYSTLERPDEQTYRLRHMATANGAAWHDVATLPSRDLTALIRKHRIDVLIDLCGLMADHRLTVFALRAAPLQVTMIGYPGTSGLASMDARIVDSLTDPVGSEAYHTERLVALDPCFLCYSPISSAPPVSPLPALAGGVITFGSFNAITKLSDQALALWGAALGAVPVSRLVLKVGGAEQPAVRDRLLARFAKANIDTARVTLLPKTKSQEEHLTQYAKIDIALDTYPYHGTTTTCEALYQGVPVVTLAGDRHASRVGISLLHAIGHPEWVAHTPEQFASIAASLATDTTKLAHLRAGLRGSLLASPLCDAKGYAARLGEALRGLWRTRPTR